MLFHHLLIKHSKKPLNNEQNGNSELFKITQNYTRLIKASVLIYKRKKYQLICTVKHFMHRTINELERNLVHSIKKENEKWENIKLLQ